MDASAYNDSFGTIESHGTDFIPEAERSAKARDMLGIFFGSQFSFGTLTVGSLPVVLGLNFYSSFMSIVVGSLIGTALFAALAVFGPSSGTNNTLTSSIYFGTRGRYIGSLITQIIDIGFFALNTWATSEVLLALGKRMFSLQSNQVSLSVVMIAVIAISVVIAIYGHKTVVGIEKFVGYTNLVVYIIFVFFSMKSFHFSPANTPYALGQFWPTWALAVTIAISNSVSYGPFASDYSRYMPKTTNRLSIFGNAFAGMFVGGIFALTVGSVIALAIDNPNNLSAGIAGMGPILLAIPLVLFSSLGTISNSSMCLYNGTLDLNAIFWKRKRVTIAIVFGVVSFIVAYVSVVLLNAIDSILNLVEVVTILITPWMVINIVGYLRKDISINSTEIQKLSSDNPGIYWYNNGFNWPAVISWVLAVICGFLFINSGPMVGPLSKYFANVDLSFTAAAIFGGVVYYILASMFYPAGARDKVA
jgi:purine-cytosine permease-like protein